MGCATFILVRRKSAFRPCFISAPQGRKRRGFGEAGERRRRRRNFSSSFFPSSSGNSYEPRLSGQLIRCLLARNTSWVFFKLFLTPFSHLHHTHTHKKRNFSVMGNRTGWSGCKSFHPQREKLQAFTGQQGRRSISDRLSLTVLDLISETFSYFLLVH